MSIDISFNKFQVRNSRTFSLSSCDTSNSSRPLNQQGLKRSRVSLLLSQLEDSLAKEYKDLIGESYELNDSFAEGYDARKISFESVSKEIPIKVNYCVAIEGNERLFTHELSLPSEMYMSEAIHCSVEAFNAHSHEVTDNDSIYKLCFITSDYSHYEFKPSKKNGKPKMDMPSFCADATLNNARVESLSLVFSEQCLIVVKVKSNEENEANDAQSNQKRKELCSFV